MMGFSDRNIVAIGGMGGSGTRVLVDVLMAAGLDFGVGVNSTMDNVFFSRFLNDPEWQRTASQVAFSERLRIFEKIMLGQVLSGEEMAAYARGVMAHKVVRQPARKVMEVRWLNWKRRLGLGGKVRESGVFAFKEPHIQVMLPQIAAYFRQLKYIHVVRHGLDMAYSSNLGLVTLWGDRLGLELPKTDAEKPMVQLEAWIRSRNAVLEFAAEHLPGRFLEVKYEDICLHPARVLPPLLDFAGISVSEVQLRELVAMPRISRSSGRFLQKDLSQFTPAQLAAVESAGYSLTSLDPK